ncbi:MAG: YwqG family protein [Chloroflexota bacterium]
MDEQALRQLLRKSKLDHIADEIVAQARPTVRVQTTPANEADIPIGASKMGGFPDLPPEFSYPYWHEALGFIGQFNMAETHPFDHEGLLPDHGLLSFFGEPSGEPFFTDWSIGLPLPVHSREDMYKGWQVHYFECDPSTLARFEPTDDLPEDEFYPCCAVNLSHTLTIPSPNSETLFPLKLTTHERTTLLNIDFEITFGEFEDHQRLGSPFELDGLPFIEAADQTDRWRRVTPEERLALERDLNQRWTVLFQLSSSSDLNMDWAGGLLYYCIERERLRVRDFTRVWLEMQFL